MQRVPTSGVATLAACVFVLADGSTLEAQESATGSHAGHDHTLHDHAAHASAPLNAPSDGAVSGPVLAAVVDLLADVSDPDAGEHGFDAELRSFEAQVSGALAPNWWAYAVAVADAEDVELEEAALHWSGIDDATTLRLGRFFVDFGEQMRLHVHELPYVDRPGVLAEYLGDELIGVGAEFERVWSLTSRGRLRTVVGAFTDFDGGHAEEDGGVAVELADRRGLGDLVFTARVAPTFDVGADSELHFGASARHLADFAFVDEANALEAPEASNTVIGGDVRFSSGVRDTTSGWSIGGEYLIALGDVGAEPDVGLTLLEVFDERVAGFHVWGERRFGRVNAVGALVGSFEHPEPGTPRDAEYALFFTRRVAEPVRLRVQVSQFDSEEASDELRVALQLTAYLGSHVHGPRDG